MSQFISAFLRQTQNMGDYRFDLAAEVAAIYADHPALAGNTVFMSTDENRDDAAPLRVHGTLLNVPENVQPHIEETLRGYMRNSLAHDTPKAFFGQRFDDEAEAAPFVMNVVVMMPTPPSPMPDAEAERNIKDFFKLRHETGHVLLPLLTENRRERYPLIECLADAYATISTLQKFGNAPDVVDVLTKLGSSRAINFISSGIADHLTTSVTAPILDAAMEHDFTTLRPDQMVELARNYAHAYTPRQQHLDAARDTFKPVRDYMDSMEDRNERPDLGKLLELTCTTALATGDKFSFSVGAHGFYPMLQGAALGGEKPILSEDMRDKLADAYIQKAASFGALGVMRLFQQNKADTTLVEIVPPLLPAPKSYPLLPAPKSP